MYLAEGGRSEAVNALGGGSPSSVKAYVLGFIFLTDLGGTK